MPDNTALVNALLAAIQRQRDEALNKLAHAEATNVVLAAENVKLREGANGNVSETTDDEV